MRVFVSDASGKGVPGVKIIVTWTDGSDTFFTGMYPEINPGYADFRMQAGGGLFPAGRRCRGGDRSESPPGNAPSRMAPHIWVAGGYIFTSREDK